MIESHLAILMAALLLDRFVGDPDLLWRRVPHPVVAFGTVISFLEKRLWRAGAGSADMRRRGRIAIALSVGLAALVGVVLSRLADQFGTLGMIVEIVIVAVFLAQKSLDDHVSAVSRALSEEGLAAGRRAVSMIVGRRTETLDEAGVTRAAVESLAENTSDGIVAPAFWFAVLGLPGLLAYKMINTADSMIGHRTERHIDFGRAAAKTDDAANWLPARLTGWLAILAFGVIDGFSAARAARLTMQRDHGLHRSPNAGWPEAAFAGGLGLSLGGPRIYDGDIADEPFMNAAGRKDAVAGDIDRALKAFRMTCTLLLALTALIWLAL